MMSTLRTLSPVVCIVAAHLGFLAYGAMLGCSFSNRVGGEVDDDMDHQNFYTCGCRCDTPVTKTHHVPAAFGKQGAHSLHKIEIIASPLYSVMTVGK